MSTIKTKFILRNDTSENWKNKNPVLAEGESGFETDTGVLKIGDGINTWNNLSSKQDYDAKFKSNNEEITISVKGKGVVLFNRHIEELDNEEEIKTFTIQNKNKGYIYIIGIENITMLDLHNNGITDIQFRQINSSINKLVLYDNNIKELNLVALKGIQFLHIFNNPICDDDEYLENLKETIKNLPDRINDSMGSIIIYPWYGLEVLIEQDENDSSYWKFPRQDIPDNGETPVNCNPSFKINTFQPNQLYGICSGTKPYADSQGNNYSEYRRKNGLFYNPDIIYYWGNENGQGINYAQEVNRHHSIRKNLETNWNGGCVHKHWVFGSAIQYSNDYEKCYYYFKNSGVQDVWETAEKGFGICVGSWDNYMTYFYNLNKENPHQYWIKNYKKYNYKGLLECDYEQNTYSYIKSQRDTTATNLEHGDCIFVQGAGRGDSITKIFGIIPNATYFLINKQAKGLGSDTGGSNKTVDTVKQWLGYIQNTVKHCNSITTSTNLSNSNYPNNEAIWLASAENKESKYLLGKFGIDNIFTAAAGNSGDDIDYTSEYGAGYDKAYGNWGKENGEYNENNHTNTFFITSLNPEKRVSSYSRSSVASTETNKITPLDYLGHYGEQIISYSSYYNNNSLYCTQGTSMSSPNCNYILALMRIIYSKMFPDEISFGKNSNFINWMREHWCDRLENQMDFSAGYGIPYFFAKNKQIDFGAIGKPIYLQKNSVKQYQPFTIEYYNHYTKKQGYTIGDFDLTKMIVSSQNQIYPLVYNDDITFNIYSNSCLNNPDKYNENYFKNSITITPNQGNKPNIIQDKVSLIQKPEKITLPNFLNNLAQNNWKLDSNDNIINKQIIPNIDANINTNNFTIQLLINLPVQADNKVNYFYWKNNDEGYNVVRSWYYSSRNSTSLGCVNTNKEQKNSIKSGFYFNSLFKNYDSSLKIVLTAQFEKEHVKFYINGYLSDILSLDGYKILPNLKNIIFNGDAYDSIDDIYVYKRTLSEEEIIQNTMAILALIN